jgi:hypothetical protein
MRTSYIMYYKNGYIYIIYITVLILLYIYKNGIKKNA